MSGLDGVARTITTLATPDIKPKDLLAAVRRHHPEASKKQVSRAAFTAMILTAEIDPDQARRVQELASRGDDGTEEMGTEAVSAVEPPRKNRKGRRKAA
ncbi:hypothetical protein [Methylobacterium nigriterrae]|uniref:hypothetical protein n=1 Tax=Methylobacterium nigriterrae TaxID=3127512 RepID=UPI003013F07D